MQPEVGAIYPYNYADAKKVKEINTKILRIKNETRIPQKSEKDETEKRKQKILIYE